MRRELAPGYGAWRGVAFATALVALLTGCATEGDSLSFARSDTNAAPAAQTVPLVELPKQQGPLADATQRGLAALSRGDFDAANRYFGIALSRDSRNAALHAMNALAYHLRVRNGERDLFELAETAYLVSIEERRDYLSVVLQLARLYYENDRFVQAKRAAVYALDLEPDNVEALRLLAASAYYGGDVELALWAVEEARHLEPADTQIATMRPVVYGAAGLGAQAQRALEEARRTGALNDRRQARLARRLDQWRGLYEEAQLTPSTPPDMPPGARIGDGPAPQQVAPPGSPVDFNSSAEAATQHAAPPKADKPRSYAWWDCRQQLGDALAAATSTNYGSGGYGYGTSGADETTILPALPAPCQGQPLPRMAMIDTVLLRTDQVRSTGYGINLLDNLSAFVQGSITTQKEYGTLPTTRTTTITQGFGLGTSASGGIAYSLNIANAADERAEILARPSLLALDRQAAQFFSGSTVSIALVSNEGGGNLQDKPVGVSVSVTPTFIDDDSMLVSVKAVRSSFEETVGTATFEQAVQTSRNMVTANVRLRFNETLILSGLSEREITSMSSRTPVLGQLPGLQYLFSAEDNRDFTRSVVILLTPRRIMNLADNLALADVAAKPEGDGPEMVREARAKALRDLGGLWPNATEALAHMDRNRLFRAVRSGDIQMDEWVQPAWIVQLLTELAGLIYH